MEIDITPHQSLIGRIAKLTEYGALLSKEYEELFKIGNPDSDYQVYQYCHMGGRYEMTLMFIDEPPFKINGVTFFCLKEIGVQTGGDWHWYSLNQLIFCKE